LNERQPAPADDDAPRDSTRLQSDDNDEGLTRLGELAVSRKVRLWVVGGWVRDRLLSRPSADRDLVVEGEPGPFIEALSAMTGRPPARLEGKGMVTWRFAAPGGHIDVTSSPAGGLDRELRRRDVTINAMAAPVGSQGADLSAVVDPTGGRVDLAGRRVRALGREALEDDPLRLLRVIRLAVVLDFAVEPQTLAWIGGMPEALATVAVERVAMEMGHVLASGRAVHGLRLMQDTGLLHQVLPFLRPLEGLAQNRWHEHDALEHTLRACAAAERMRGPMPEVGLGEPVGADLEILMWAALLHDAGKAATAARGEDGQTHFHGHEIVSETIARRFLEDLRIAARTIDRTTLLVRHHLRLILLSSGDAATERAIRRLVHRMKEDVALLCRLALADLEAAGGWRAPSRLQNLRRLVSRVMGVAASDGGRLMSPPPLLTGTEVMEILGIAPGPRVGAVLRWLTRLQVDQRIASREEAEAMLRSLPPSRLG
jgi:putative nucleotidyltransferase with HDIG domain